MFIWYLLRKKKKIKKIQDEIEETIKSIKNEDEQKYLEVKNSLETVLITSEKSRMKKIGIMSIASELIILCSLIQIFEGFFDFKLVMAAQLFVIILLIVCTFISKTKIAKAIYSAVIILNMCTFAANLFNV